MGKRKRSTNKCCKCYCCRKKLISVKGSKVKKKKNMIWNNRDSSEEETWNAQQIENKIKNVFKSSVVSSNSNLINAEPDILKTNNLTQKDVYKNFFNGQGNVTSPHHHHHHHYHNHNAQKMNENGNENGKVNIDKFDEADKDDEINEGVQTGQPQMNEDEFEVVDDAAPTDNLNEIEL